MVVLVSRGAGRPRVANRDWAEWLARRLTQSFVRIDRNVRSMIDGNEWQRMFLFSRAETIYGGSDEIQREIIAHRILGLPR